MAHNHYAPDDETLLLLQRLCQSGRARELREQAGIGLRQAATQVGVGRGQLSRWERGEQVPVSSGTVHSYVDFLANLSASRTARLMTPDAEGSEQ